jgi:peptidyl-prolyl cis-trans isomerase D
MFTFIRNMTKSTIGVVALVAFLVLIMASFAIADVSSLQPGGALSSSTLAKAGSLEITDRDMSTVMQRRLAQVREQNPEAGYPAIEGEFEPLLQTLIDERALQAFARKHGFVLSKLLVDAEIANIPGVRGLAGQVTQESYQAFLAQQRMTDAEMRQLISGSLLQRLLLTPAASNARVPIGIATHYASMLLEERQGEIAMVPLASFAAGLNPTDAQLQQFYAANRSRYTVPEQRVLRLARIGPEQGANVTATPQEIAANYKANQAQYAATDIRVISQAVVPDQNVARQIAQRARGGQSFVEAVKPAGLSGADVSVGPQSRQQFANLAGDKVAAAAFNASAGEIVGPVQSDLGWHVVKVDSVKTQPGRSLAQVRDEIAERITAEKRAAALGDLINRVQDAIDGGANFDEAAKAANLPVTTTPPITASGSARGDPSYEFPEELAPALKSGFELMPSDEPIVDQLPDNRGFVMVAPAEVMPAAPAPLASIRDRVRADWIQNQAAVRARAAAAAIASKASGEVSLSDAAKQANVQLPPVQPARARRIQLSEMGDQVPAPLRVLFTIAEGRTQVGADPQGRGFFVVKVNEIIPGNALNQPRLITEVQTQFSEPLAQEYAQQFLAAAKLDVGVERNDTAIAESKRRISGTGN